MPPRFAVVPKERRTLDGVTFDSSREMKRYAVLKLMERAGDITGLQRQPQFKVFINAKLFCTYTADFAYWTDHGRTHVIEDVKSTGTAKDAAYRLRKKAAELQYGIKVTEVTK